MEMLAEQKFAIARSSLPSVLKSPTATDSGVSPHREVGGGPKGAGAGAQQDGYVVGAGVHHDQVELAVPVEIPHRHGSGVKPHREVGGRPEGTGASAQQDGYVVGAVVGHSQ